MKSKLILTAIIVMMIGCDKAEGGGEPTTPKTISTDVTPKKQTPIANYNNDGLDWTYVEIDLDDMLFEDAFRVQYNAKGEGHTFWWNGEQYTTNLHTGSIVTSGWVQNSDDIDDKNPSVDEE